jgi:hypothetical protein
MFLHVLCCQYNTLYTQYCYDVLQTVCVSSPCKLNLTAGYCKYKHYECNRVYFN